VEQILIRYSVDPKLLDTTIRLACDRAIAAEPNLTKWDMVMGDGDCGEAVKDVSEGNIFLSIYAFDSKPILQQFSKSWTATPLKLDLFSQPYMQSLMQ
jgi:hypothetical protein